MALGSALVDRARSIRNASTGAKVEGTTIVAPVAGDWFRCRLTLPQQPEAPDQQDGRRRVEQRPSLLFEPLDERGQTINLTVEDYIEVDSPELGRFTFILSADPEPLRKRRTVLGYEVAIRRVEDHERDTP